MIDDTSGALRSPALDVFALGAVLAQCATANAAFDSHSHSAS